jgi:hypothetical protein
MVSVPLATIAAELDSYFSQVDVAAIVAGFGWFESHLYPLTIDFTLGGSIAASWLLARWGAPRGPRAVLALMILGSAIATVAANALHGWAVSDHATIPWALRAVVSAVPGAAIVSATHQAVLVARYRPRPGLADEERESEPQQQAHRPKARAKSTPKQVRVRALLEERGLANLDPRARAEVIGAVARETRTSAQYVRRIAREFRAPSNSEPDGEEGAA